MGILIDWLVTGVFMAFFEWLFDKKKSSSANSQSLENAQESKDLEVISPSVENTENKS